MVKALEKNAYLTGVTELGDKVLFEYIGESHFRYALLANMGGFDSIARIPGYRDVYGDMVVADDGAGHLRGTKVYSAGELLGMVNASLGGKTLTDAQRALYNDR